jgi:WD40 repeat protein
MSGPSPPWPPSWAWPWRGHWADGGHVEMVARDQGEVLAIAFSSDGRHLASGGQDGTIWLRDLAGLEQPTALRGHQDGVLGVAHSPDGRLLASSGEDGTIRAWYPLDAVGSVVIGIHAGGVQRVVVSADGHTIVSAGNDSTVRIIDVALSRDGKQWRARALTAQPKYGTWTRSTSSQS